MADLTLDEVGKTAYACDMDTAIIAEKTREARKAAGLTIRQAAAKAALNASTVHGAETEARPASMKTLTKLADAYGVERIESFWDPDWEPGAADAAA